MGDIEHRRIAGRIAKTALLIGGKTGLNQRLALVFGDERLQLGSGEGIDKTGFRNDQQKDLCARQR